jgi:hypothetical protein
MTCGAMEVAGEDGFELVTQDHKELVASAQQPAEHPHRQRLSESEVMTMSKHP